jgi:STE24 endopeptidase
MQPLWYSVSLPLTLYLFWLSLMNSWLIAVTVIICISYALETTVSVLNVRALSPNLPEEFKDIYSTEEYKKSQNYTRTNTSFGLVENSWSTAITLIFCF